MSQKTNPTSLRLQKNFQNFAYPLFADCFWSETYKACFESQKYITAFLKETSFSKAFFSAKIFYRKFPVFIFLQDNRLTKKEKLLFFKKSLLQRKLSRQKKLKTNYTVFDIKSQNKNLVTPSVANNKLSFLKSNKDLGAVKKLFRDDFLKARQGFFKNLPYTESINLVKLNKSTLLPDKKEKKVSLNYFLPRQSATMFPKVFARPCLSFCENVIASSSRTTCDVQRGNLSIYNALFTSQKIVSKLNAPFIETLIGSTTVQLLQNQNSTSKEIKECLQQMQKRKIYLNKALINAPFFPTKMTFEPIRFIREDQNVTALVDVVVTLLEKRISFRQIKSLLFKNILLNQEIKGVRISCSGRLGGRSKKAQKAKVQSDSCGATTLAAFSSKIAFASKSAHTSYGKVGVKIWLSFNDKRC